MTKGQSPRLRLERLMSHRSSTLGLIGGALLAAACPCPPAWGADLDYGFGNAPQPIAESKVEFGSGWYIRGDLSLTHTANIVAGDEAYDTGGIGNVITGISGQNCSSLAPSPNCTYNNAYQYNRSVFVGPTAAAPSLSANNSSRLGYDATIGGGYQFNRWFRFDATFDFLKPVQSSYQGNSLPCITGTSALPPQNPQLPPNSENILSANCTPSLNASLKSYATLINGYVDFGTWYRITPYVGAGVGLSFGHASASATYIQNNGVPYQVSYTDALSNTSVYQNWNRSRSLEYYNLAFALMGGIAIDVYSHTKLDIGYRYLHLGNVLGAELTTQEVRAGLRYMIDN